VALHSAKFASETIVEAIAADDFSEMMLMPYERTLRKGVEIWYEFIRLYYKMLPLFTYFVQLPKYRMQIFRLLQGEVFEKGEVPVLQAMRDFIEMVENDTTGKFHNFQKAVTDVPIGADLDGIGEVDTELMPAMGD
jgi:FADH2 O2-dependent halogenase